MACMTYSLLFKVYSSDGRVVAFQMNKNGIITCEAVMEVFICIV